LKREVAAFRVAPDSRALPPLEWPNARNRHISVPTRTAPLRHAGKVERPRVVVVGGGFGGLNVAKGLAGKPFDIVMIDRRNFHLFQPLLYQVATGSLSPANIAAPLRWALRGNDNLRVLLDEVSGIDIELRHVEMTSQTLAYDYLVVATGSSHAYFSHPEWEQFAPGLKTIEDATEIRSKIFFALEEADLLGAARREAVTFVVVGGGPTGVELAGAIAEIIRDTLHREYVTLREDETRVLLLEAAGRILPTYPEFLSRKAEQSLRKLGVDVRTSTRVLDLDASGLDVDAAGREERIPSTATFWAAGVQASRLGRQLAGASGAGLDRQGRVVVAPDLSLERHPEVFVIGDLAHCEQDGKPLPALAAVAMQQGRYVAHTIESRIHETPLKPFRYRDSGLMATIGRSAAVGIIGPVRLWGMPGWLAWLLIHLVKLNGYQNRLLVLIQWAWNYFTRSRSARLISGEVERRLRLQASHVRRPSVPAARHDGG
jgi:NADH dehydrogenase